MLAELRKTKPRPRPATDRRRSASWHKAPVDVLGDPSDSASTLTRENAAMLKQSLCSARGIEATRFPGAAAASPRASVTARSPSIADIFGQAAMRPTVTPIRLEEMFSAAAGGGAAAPTPEAETTQAAT